MVCLARFLQLRYITTLDCIPSFKFYERSMVENVTLLILVFLVLVVIFVLVFWLCTTKNSTPNNFSFVITDVVEQFAEFWGNHQKIFEFLL